MSTSLDRWKKGLLHMDASVGDIAAGRVYAGQLTRTTGALPDGTPITAIAPDGDRRIR
jgi:hypothetical protein